MQPFHNVLKKIGGEQKNKVKYRSECLGEAGDTESLPCEGMKVDAKRGFVYFTCKVKHM